MTQTPSLLPAVERALLAGDIGRAVALARRALDAGERAPLFLTLRARWLEANGRPAEAATDLEAAISASVPNSTLLTALARCLAETGHFVRAAAIARAALDLDPSQAEAHFQLGFAQEQLGELDAARASYEAAARFDPAQTDAMARLAALAARRGDWSETRRLADQAPDRITARFACIMADIAEGHAARAETEARAIADVPDPRIQASALNFLADALDAQDRPAEAFAAYTKARATQKTVSRAQFERPGAETGRRMAVRLDAEFAAAAWPPPDGAPARSPVFVLGFPRSGTTLLAEILAGHPGAVILDEKPVLRDSILAFTGQPGGLARLASAGPDEIEALRGRYWQRAAEAAGTSIPGDALVIDKVPVNTLHLPVIARLFPGARVLFALRDPRDVVFACFRRQFAINPFTYEFLSLETAAEFYDRTMRLADLYRARLPLAVMDMRNEDLAAAPESAITKLCAFLGIATSPAMADFASRPARRAIASPAAASLAAGIRGTNMAPWQRYAEQMAPVLPTLEPWARRFGYPA